MTLPKGIRSRAVSKEELEKFVNEELVPFLRQLQSAYKVIAGGIISGGAGAPIVPPPSGVTVALYLRNDGGVGTTLYLYRAAAWAAIA